MRPWSIITIVLLTLVAAEANSSAEVGSGELVAAWEFLAGPPNVKGPVEVAVSFDLRDIDHVDDESETFEFTGVLKTSWKDIRRAFDPVVEGVSEKTYQGDFQFNEFFAGWYPQLILVNRSGHFEKHGVLLRVRLDGSVSLFETVNAVAKIDLDLRRYPFDEQRLDAVFHVLGFERDEIVLTQDSDFESEAMKDRQSIRMPQWSLLEVESSIGTRRTPLIGRGAKTSTFTVSAYLERSSFFVVRLVILPLIIIVMLSWSVFWMDKSSLGDRLSVSFIGILTAVTYQVILSEILPRISYVTLINDGFLLLSFVVMTMTVIVNLRVGYLDRHGMSDDGDRLDYLCRWAFPLVYFGLLALVALLIYWL